MTRMDVYRAVAADAMTPENGAEILSFPLERGFYLRRLLLRSLTGLVFAVAAAGYLAMRGRSEWASVAGLGGIWLLDGISDWRELRKEKREGRAE